MIYLPSENPTPERPPRINREIVGVLLAMACISGLLIHYTRDTWCGLPVLGAFCLPPLVEPQQEATLPDDGSAGGNGELSHPSNPATVAPTPPLVDSAAGIAPAIPTPSLFATPYSIGPGGLAYPGPGSAQDGSVFPGGLAPPANSFVVPTPTLSVGSFSTVSASVDYGATATAMARAYQDTATPGTPSATSTGATATVGTPTAATVGTPTASAYPGPRGTATSADSAYP